ncbi:hypothetical protein Shyd_33830 [Streptomyces hydrogenans]|uniref:Uncharacterized protein n=1 Tax=Streptomyces hydrogenans TaxID=1873719 RepID=A0ABQ3PAF0_9ACTN|nr:hypothetical protein GCM10018784_48080 [Streptomyces hydrogenans]GHI22012.1 hypothetical protein Shyd_33830 [Streptomyces hydrogenans]
MKGFAQIAAPTRVRSSKRIPPALITAKTAIAAANQRRGRCGRPLGGGEFEAEAEAGTGSGVDMRVDIRIPP